MASHFDTLEELMKEVFVLIKGKVKRQALSAVICVKKDASGLHSLVEVAQVAS